MRPLKVGLLGLGGMGLTHLNQYRRLEREGFPVKLVAVCDKDEQKLNGQFVSGNIPAASENVDLSDYRLYRDVDAFLNEGLGFIDIVLPTQLHDEMTIKALNKGFHVLCEKPMAITSERAIPMLHAAQASEKKLMIAHCLRFWPEYEYLKHVVSEETYGKVLSAQFYRGGPAPLWSSDNWMLDPSRSGGPLLDLHIHDVDIIHWLFGMPKQVSALMADKAGFDVISAHYAYEDGKVVQASADLSLPGDIPFQMTYRVHLQNATITLDQGGLKVYETGKKPEVLDLGGDDGYYREIKYFVEAIMNEADVTTSPPEQTVDTMHIIEAARFSAEADGAWVAPRRTIKEKEE